MTPLPRDQLERCLAEFPGAARTLPAEAYHSDEVFTFEMSHFFAGGWVLAGRASEVDSPGDQRAIRIGGEGVLLTRDHSGVLRGFSNVCRHRGHELLECGGPSVNRAVVQCPYHRWTYDLDGAFKGGPGLASEESFDATDPEHSLVPVAIGEWGGWIFVNVDGNAGPFGNHLGRGAKLAAPYESERAADGGSISYDVAANWKLIVENYHECYHCSEIHPELCRISPPGSGADFEPSGAMLGGSMELVPGAVTMSLDGRSEGVRFRGLDDSAARFVHYVGLFPSVLFSFHPDYVMTHTLRPLGPDATRVECQWLFAPESLDKPGFDPSYAVDFWDLTNRQDWKACEAVQRGVTGRGFRQSPFSERERVVHLAMAMVARGYLEDRVLPVGSDNFHPFGLSGVEP